MLAFHAAPRTSLQHGCGRAGPLGQGVGNAVGLAAAEAHLAARFNKDDCKIVDHYTYCIMGDGCAMLQHEQHYCC